MSSKRRRKFDTEGEDMGVVRDLGNRKKFHRHDIANITPKTYNQEAFIRACFQDTPLVAALGWPGVGKSFLSLFTALTDVFEESTPYEKVILVRSAVQGRQIGFTPGNLDEKMAPYEYAYTGIISELMPRYNNGYNHLKALGYLEFHSTSMMRSVTFDNSIIILSECQNMDYDELYTCITRVGENSKIILEGDETQDDLKRQREKSGLSRIRSVIQKMPSDMCEIIDFRKEDIVRSEFTKQFIIAASELT